MMTGPGPQSMTTALLAPLCPHVPSYLLEIISHHCLPWCPERSSVFQIRSVQFSSVQSLSRIQLCDPMNRSTPGLPVHHQLPEFTQTHFHRVGDAIQPSHPRSSPSPPAPNPFQHQSLFQWVNSSHEVAKVLSFSFSIIPSKEIPGLISFRMDWLDLLAVQGTLKWWTLSRGFQQTLPKYIWGITMAAIAFWNAFLK